MVFAASSATATTFDDVTIEELARASDIVVLGQVELVDCHDQGPAGQSGIHTRAVVRVTETLHGENERLLELWVHGGRIGDTARLVPSQATFREGERVALFLFRSRGALWLTGMGRGKWVISDSGSAAPWIRDGIVDASTGRIDVGVLRSRVLLAVSRRP